MISKRHYGSIRYPLVRLSPADKSMAVPAFTLVITYVELEMTFVVMVRLDSGTGIPNESKWKRIKRFPGGGGAETVGIRVGPLLYRSKHYILVADW
jgi:hypothetical protein